MNPLWRKPLSWGAVVLSLLFLGSMSCRFGRIHTLARLGHVKSMMELGGAYASISGQGLTSGSNWKEATYWFEKAGAKGYGKADFALFQMWQVLGDPADIRRWLQRGASNGDSACTMELAKAYDYGLYGFQKDPEKSRYWTKKIPKWRP